MTLRTAITSDAGTVFTSASDFAEAVQYLPRHGVARSINAVVIREALETAEEGIIVHSWQVHVANDAVLGISGDELDIGGDSISLPPRDGEGAKTKTITQVLVQDHGMLVLQVQ